MVKLEWVKTWDPNIARKTTYVYFGVRGVQHVILCSHKKNSAKILIFLTNDVRVNNGVWYVVIIFIVGVETRYMTYIYLL